MSKYVWAVSTTFFIIAHCGWYLPTKETDRNIKMIRFCMWKHVVYKLCLTSKQPQINFLFSGCYNSQNIFYNCLDHTLFIIATTRNRCRWGAKMRDRRMQDRKMQDQKCRVVRFSPPILLLLYMTGSGLSLIGEVPRFFWDTPRI